MGSDPDWPVTDMALRCLNNALFLNEDARLPFSSEDVGGGHVAVALLSRPQDTPADILFLGARLLFFSTLFESPFNKTAVTVLNAVRIEAACADALAKAIQEKAKDRSANSSVLLASGSEAQLNMALSDLLKAHFNICLYYPRIAEAEAKQQQQQGEANGQAAKQKTNHSEPYSAKLSTLSSSKCFDAHFDPHRPSVAITHPADAATHTRHRCFAQLSVSHIKKEIARTKEEAATTLELTAPISDSSSNALRSASSYISRLIVLSDLMLARFFSVSVCGSDDSRRVPEDVDAKAIKQKASADGIDLEDTLEPLLLLLRKTAAEDDELRSTIRSILLPSDLERSLALDRRVDVLGRIVRLMSSVTLPRLARASGEVLLAVCDGDAKKMTEAIGYGPCAGFLMSNGLASALPTSSVSANSNGRSIDPITGEYEPTEEERAMDEISRMTEEEKEAEAEKLFVLFDRLNKTGVVQVKHPMAAAQEEGRFEEIGEKQRAEEQLKREQEEDELEREVERDMAAHKKRKKRLRIGRRSLFLSQYQRQPKARARVRP